jgi:hypothetical protein
VTADASLISTGTVGIAGAAVGAGETKTAADIASIPSVTVAIVDAAGAEDALTGITTLISGTVDIGGAAQGVVDTLTGIATVHGVWIIIITVLRARLALATRVITHIDRACVLGGLTGDRNRIATYSGGGIAHISRA